MIYCWYCWNRIRLTDMLLSFFIDSQFPKKSCPRRLHHPLMMKKDLSAASESEGKRRWSRSKRSRRRRRRRNLRIPGTLTELLNFYCLSQALSSISTCPSAAIDFDLYELKIFRLRDELNNNHETVDNRTVDKSVSSGTSTEDIANMDTE